MNHTHNFAQVSQPIHPANYQQPQQSSSQLPMAPAQLSYVALQQLLLFLLVPHHQHTRTHTHEEVEAWLHGIRVNCYFFPIAHTRITLRSAPTMHCILLVETAFQTLHRRHYSIPPLAVVLSCSPAFTYYVQPTYMCRLHSVYCVLLSVYEPSVNCIVL